MQRSVARWSRALRMRIGGLLPVMLAAALVVLAAWTDAAEAQLRIVSYNTARLLGNNNDLRDVLEHIMYDDKPGFDVPISIIVFQEVNQSNFAVLEQLLNDAAPPGVLYVGGTFTNLGEDCCAGAQAMFYRAGMLIEDSSGYASMYTGAGRYTRRWRLRLTGYDTPDAGFYIYSSHLKASQGTDNQQQRLAGVETILDNAATLPPGSPIIYAGDMNFYSNTEPGYLKFIQPGPVQALDPLGTGNWGGPGNAIKHSQSPRDIQSGGLIGGGMNQRFDFQLSTAALHDGNGFSIMPDTYRSFGNDGQKYNDAINDGNNFYYPFNVPLSNAIADALHDASDHIPVIAEYQIPARMFVTGPPSDLGFVIQGGDAQASFTVNNNVNNVVVPDGADVLVYEAVGSGDLFGSFADEVEALSAGSEGSVSIDTSEVGPFSGAITFTSDNVAAHNAEVVVNTSGTVLRASQPSFDARAEVIAETIELDLDPDTGAHQFSVNVFNFEFDGSQALLNVDDVTGVEPPFFFVGGLAEDIGPGSAELLFEIDTDGLSNGLYESTVTIHTSDEPLPGAGTATLNLMLAADVGVVPACPGDVTGSGTVNVDDLLVVLNNWGLCSDPNDCDADVNGDELVNVDDLLIVLNNWGACPE